MMTNQTPPTQTDKALRSEIQKILNPKPMYWLSNSGANTRIISSIYSDLIALFQRYLSQARIEEITAFFLAGAFRPENLVAVKERLKELGNTEIEPLVKILKADPKSGGAGNG